jgi:hypothetical protein
LAKPLCRLTCFVAWSPTFVRRRRCRHQCTPRCCLNDFSSNKLLASHCQPYKVTCAPQNNQYRVRMMSLRKDPNEEGWILNRSETFACGCTQVEDCLHKRRYEGRAKRHMFVHITVPCRFVISPLRARKKDDDV